MLGQDRLEAILRHHIASRYGISVEFGTALKAFEQTSDRIVAHLVKRQDGIAVEEIQTVHWLIGADGPGSELHSLPQTWRYILVVMLGGIRKQLGIAYSGETRDEQKFIIGDVHVHTSLDRHVGSFFMSIN